MTVFNINLIAARRRQKQRAKATNRLGIYSLIVLAIGVVMLYFMMQTEIQEVDAQLQKVRSELTSPGLSDKVNTITDLERQTAQLQPRVAVLEKVHSSEAEWIRIVSDIGACAPREATLWLTQMTTDRSDKAQTISLRGQAYRQEAIGSYMISLSKPTWSGDPSLGFSQVQRNPNGAEVFNFEVSVPLLTVIGSDLK